MNSGKHCSLNISVHWKMLHSFHCVEYLWVSRKSESGVPENTLLSCVSYKSLWWHCVAKPFLKGSTRQDGTGEVNVVPKVRLAAKEGKQRHIWVGWWDVDKTSRRHPEGRIQMQGAGTEDTVSLDPAYKHRHGEGLHLDEYSLLGENIPMVLPMVYLTPYEEFPQLFKFDFFENNRKFWSLEIKSIAITESFEPSLRGNIFLY